MSDDYYQGLCDVLNDALKRATTELRLERQRTAALQAQINRFPATASELQDRVTLLESRLKRE